MSGWNKRELAQRVLSDLIGNIEDARSASDEARLEANKQSGAMQSRYDTFREEGQALSGAHAKRFHDLRESLSSVEEFASKCVYLVGDAPKFVTVGTVVTVEDGDELQQHFFLVPAGGGAQIDTKDGAVHVLNLSSPMGRALLHKEVGDEVIVQVASGRRIFSIVAIQ